MTRMSREEYLAMVAKRRQIPQAKPNKYGAIRTQVDGMTFDSKAEARYYEELKLRQQAGEILWFNCQPSFKVSREVRYVPDFIVCEPDGTIHVVDVKSPATAKNSTFAVKAKLFREKYPTIELKLVQ